MKRLLIAISLLAVPAVTAAQNTGKKEKQTMPVQTAPTEKTDTIRPRTHKLHHLGNMDRNVHHPAPDSTRKEPELIAPEGKRND